MEDGDLTSLSNVEIMLDGTDAQVASAWRTFSGSITLTRGSETLPNVTTASFSGLEVDTGATLDFPASSASVTDTGEMIIGGTLAVAAKLTLTSAATLEELINGAPAAGKSGRLKSEEPPAGRHLQSRAG